MRGEGAGRHQSPGAVNTAKYKRLRCKLAYFVRCVVSGSDLPRENDVATGSPLTNEYTHQPKDGEPQPRRGSRFRLQSDVDPMVFAQNVRFLIDF